MKNGHLVKRLVVATLALGLLGANIKTMAEQAAESRRLSILSVKGENGFVIKGGTREIKATAGMPLGQGSKVKTGASSNPPQPRISAPTAGQQAGRGRGADL